MTRSKHAVSAISIGALFCVAFHFCTACDTIAVMSIRMRHTRGHTGNRRSHHALSEMNVVKDTESGNLRLPHRVDEVTGMYRGKQIFSPKTKAEHKHKEKGPDTEPATP